MRRNDLIASLEAVPLPSSPKGELEQVRTPPAVAADLLMAAHQAGAVSGRRVLDLGCGTGVLSWGAAALGADVLGVDVDPDAVAQAKNFPGRGKAEFQVADVATWRPDEAFDTVVMNPPFGAHRANRHADRPFYACAADAVHRTGTVWFLAQTRTEGFLQAEAHRLGASITRIGAWKYPLQAAHGHHAQQARLLDVGGYLLTWRTAT